MKLFSTLVIIVFSVTNFAFAQININNIAPPNWWADMENNSLQIIIDGNNLNSATCKWKTPGVVLESYYNSDNGNYLILNIKIKKWAPIGNHIIQIKRKDENYIIKYPIGLKEQTTRNYGLNSTDFIYLIMPDRFANGEPDNDIIEGMNEVSLCRDSMFLRHGGDLQGIIDNIDYIKDLGITAIWLTPVMENNQPYESYHGYAITNHYKIDPRIGNIELYKTFVDNCHNRGIKVVKDIVLNHVGDKHYLYNNPPDSDCFNYWDNFTRTSYRASTLMDPYASESDKNVFKNAWFDKHMPDINHDNEIIANYLIQNCIWWIEETKIDAFRIDTYAYSDQNFMSELAARIFMEYPGFGMFGETWVHGQGIQQWFSSGKKPKKNINSLLPGTTDFQWYYAVNEALTTKQSWTGGVSRLYYTLVQDYLYESPENNVIFLDNHDLSRFYSIVNEDFNKFRSGLILLSTMRGIPMLYYGTEILMKNFADPDGKVREDFPGGWKNDKANAFKNELSQRQLDAINLVKKLTKLRLEYNALQSGEFKHFVPLNDIYVYFRYNNKDKFMIVLNTGDSTGDISSFNLEEFLGDKTTLTDILNDKTIHDIYQLKIPANYCYLLKVE
jgi:neopullulanase